MSLYGNLDFANNAPHMPLAREVRVVSTGTTANLTLGGSKVLVFTANVSNAVQPGSFVYGDDANGILSKLAKDASNGDLNELVFWRSNNTVASVSGNTVILNNIATTNYAAGRLVYFANLIMQDTTTTYANYANDTILVTASRIANTKGTVYGYGSDVSNTQIGNINVGWNKITRKINNDGTIRFLKETLVALASPVASNVSSANTSSNAIFGGL
jgi:hypothetical protein